MGVRLSQVLLTDSARPGRRLQVVAPLSPVKPRGPVVQGIVFTGGSQAQLKAFPDPEPGYGEVVVRIRASGMCGSDLHSYRAPTPAADGHRLLIQGHEPCVWWI